MQVALGCYIIFRVIENRKRDKFKFKLGRFYYIDFETIPYLLIPRNNHKLIKKVEDNLKSRYLVKEYFLREKLKTYYKVTKNFINTTVLPNRLSYYKMIRVPIIRKVSFREETGSYYFFDGILDEVGLLE